MKQKRIKRQKASEKTDNYYYPTEDELLAERTEVKPSLVITIYDKEGNVMRKLNAPLRKGYQSISWDMGYLNARGPKVPPGDYTLAIDKNDNGEFTRLAEDQPFTIIALPNAMGTANYQANFDFIKEVNDFYLTVSAASGKITNMNERLDAMKKMLENMPTEANVLVAKIDAMKKQVEGVTKVISGGFGAKNTVSGRLRFAQFTTASAQVDITGSQREQFDIAKSDYRGQEAILNDLFDIKLPALEAEYVSHGGVLHVTPPAPRRFFEE